MRTLSILALLALVLAAGCVIDGLDPSYGTVDDLIEETTSAVGSDGIPEHRSVDCLEEEPGGVRQVASIRFPDVTDTDAALNAIFTAWSTLWPDSTVQESDERITVLTTPGAAAATLFDEDGVFRVDLVGPCEGT